MANHNAETQIEMRDGNDEHFPVDAAEVVGLHDFLAAALDVQLERRRRSVALESVQQSHFRSGFTVLHFDLQT